MTSRSRADDERVRVGHRFEERVALDVVGGLDIVAGLAEPRQTGVSDRVRNEYLHTESNFRGRQTVLASEGYGDSVRTER